jgi:hypothetical protein
MKYPSDWHISHVDTGIDRASVIFTSGYVASRIYDSDDPTRIFEWMIDESQDDKGNIIVYEYKQENSDNVNYTLAHEKNRLGKPYSKNYVKRIKSDTRRFRLSPRSCF